MTNEKFTLKVLEMIKSSLQKAAEHLPAEEKGISTAILFIDAVKEELQ